MVNIELVAPLLQPFRLHLIFVDNPAWYRSLDGCSEEQRRIESVELSKTIPKKKTTTTTTQGSMKKTGKS